MDPATQTALTPEFAVGCRDLILSTMVAEQRTTRNVLSAVPEDGKDYRPDPKARTAHELAWHIVYEDVRFLNMIADLRIELGEAEPAPATIAGILAWYDENFPRAVERVQDLTPQQLLTPVDFFGIMKEPVFKYLLLSSNHGIHHRGELVTYLRPMGSKVPSIYGPSADEPFPAAA